MPLMKTRIPAAFGLVISFSLLMPLPSQAGDSDAPAATVLAAASDEVSRAPRLTSFNASFGDYLAAVVANSWRDLSAAADFMPCSTSLTIIDTAPAFQM